MFANSIQKAKESIFPIVLTLSKDGEFFDTRVAGTGFFLDNDGHFATALHVVKTPSKTEQYNQASFGSLGNIPNITLEKASPEKIIEIGKEPELDLFVGKLSKTVQKPLPILEANPSEGTSIVIGGYPFPRIKRTSDDLYNFFTVRQYWQSTMIMDYLNIKHFDPKMPYEGFLVDNRTIPGMSGGPALNAEGEVVGMCTAQITRNAKGGIPHINGVCLDAKSLSQGISQILGDNLA